VSGRRPDGLFWKAQGTRGQFRPGNPGHPGYRDCTQVHSGDCGVTRESRAESRFEASHAAGLTPLVGREREIGLLLERWQQTREGEGQAVLLSGEPGIGKSRITQALRERIASDAKMHLRYQCSPHHATSAHRTMRPAHSTRSSNRSDGPPESTETTVRIASWTSCKRPSRSTVKFAGEKAAKFGLLCDVTTELS
jgi:hypothetical protein